MNTITAPERMGGTFQPISPKWQFSDEGRAYACRVLLCPEAEGGFSAHAMRLPGVVSEGDSESEAIENLIDAFESAVRSYLETQMDIPWRDEMPERPVGALERWFIVNV